MKVMPSQKNAKKIIRISQNSPGCVKKNCDFSTESNKYLAFHRSAWWELCFFLKNQAELYVLENINEE